MSLPGVSVTTLILSSWLRPIGSPAACQTRRFGLSMLARTRTMPAATFRGPFTSVDLASAGWSDPMLICRGPRHSLT